MPLFPIWIHERGTKKPDKMPFYEISADGVFLHKETPFWKAIVPVEHISILEKQEPQFESLLPPIPKTIVKQVARFFAWITNRYYTEALVLLWWNENNSSYEITVPSQDVSPQSLRYQISDERNNGTHLIGTFHSHHSMSAFHSGVDIHDEINFDGIHGTFGSFTNSSWLDPNSFSLSLQSSINGFRFTMNPLEWLQGIAQFDSGRKNQSGILQLEIRNLPKYSLTDNGVLLPVGYQPPVEWLQNVKIMPPPLSFLDHLLGTPEKEVK